MTWRDENYWEHYTGDLLGWRTDGKTDIEFECRGEARRTLPRNVFESQERAREA